MFQFPPNLSNSLFYGDIITMRNPKTNFTIGTKEGEHSILVG